MIAQHTPGEWVVDEKTAHVNELKTGFHLLALQWPTTKRSEEETMANARLIAGSPSLYDFVLSRAEQGDAEALNLLISLNLCDHAENA